MNAIDNLLLRNSRSKLGTPYPKDNEMKLVYKAALRAPDHAWLRPSRFIEITGKGLDRLSEIFQNYSVNNIKDIDDAKTQKYKNAPYRAPMIIIIISDIREHPKVPEIEQILSTAAAAQNILLALNALNYGAIWRTGIFALNERIGEYFKLDCNQKILGYIYVGTPFGKAKKIPEINIEDFVTKWN